MGRCKGQIDGKYNIYMTIGRGQFAKYDCERWYRVKLGQDMETMEWCAIKIMKDINSLEKLEKFMNEARLLSLCSEPNIVRMRAVSIAGTLVNQAGHKRNIVYHVTCYAMYGELYQLIKDTGCFSERLARTYFLQLLKGMCGTIH